MNLRVVYCNHQTTDLTIRERLAFSTPEQVERAYEELRARFPQSEHVVVSTCNRVEVYTAGDSDHSATSRAELATFLSDFHRLPTDDFFDDLLEQTGPEAVRHLFEVASSVDSMVLGENQIVNQVKEAYEQANSRRANGPITNALFQRAMAVSRRVRTETRLGEGRLSVASVAVGVFARQIFAHFDDKRVVVIGAGEMAEETIQYLKEAGARDVSVVNRSFEKAQALAAQVGGVAKAWDGLDRWLMQADVVVSATGAERPIVDANRFRQIRADSGERPIFILDLGAPRDFDPAVSDVDDGVFLYDVDDLKATCEKNRKAREQEVVAARRIIDEETSRFMHDVYHSATGPIIKRLREHWHDISRQEMELLFRKMPDLSDADREAIQRSVERIVNKLLHPPLETLRDESQAGTPHGLLDAIKRLFHIAD